MPALAIREDRSAEALRRLACREPLDAACRAWNALVAEPERIASLTAYPYLVRSNLR